MAFEGRGGLTGSLPEPPGLVTWSLLDEAAAKMFVQAARGNKERHPHRRSGFSREPGGFAESFAAWRPLLQTAQTFCDSLSHRRSGFSREGEEFAERFSPAVLAPRERGNMGLYGTTGLATQGARIWRRARAGWYSSPRTALGMKKSTSWPPWKSSIVWTV